jgi:dienelactone hydrolase
MNRPALLLILVTTLTLPVLFAADKDTKTPTDSRLGPPVDLNKSYFPFKPPATKEAWEARRKELREQLQVALGLWPMPEKTPLNPVIHGKINRDGYTIEKVFFASMPGHYVSGNLYRPLAPRELKEPKDKRPAVLFAHGHWANGRLFEAPDNEVEASLKSGGEKTKEGARYPLQALPAQLARMGCVVFVYDMVGVADSKALEHAKGFADADAELHQQSAMGLQTWNSIRALDFLSSLPDVDVKRIGMTGASGGGTQTFILCAIDDRPAVAFPAVMVSTAMQGGCVCENCSYLRQSTGNVEIAALFAPKPLGMTGAKDWTEEIETKGLPELKALYKLYGAEDKVMAKCFPEYPHNYNQVSREVMYNWFNKHLALGQKEPVTEQAFEPVPPKELSVYDTEHPRPKDSLNVEALRKQMTEASDKQIDALRPKDAESLKEFKRVVGTALRVMVHDVLPKTEETEVRSQGSRAADAALALSRAKVEGDKLAGVIVHHAKIGRKGEPNWIPALEVIPPGFDGTFAVWVHPKGRASVLDDKAPTPAAKAILDKKVAIFVFEPLNRGETGPDKPLTVNEKFAGFTFGYNRPLLAERVRDILTAVAFVRGPLGAKHVHLIGWDAAGPWTLMARALCGDAVDRCAVDVDGFRFDKVTKTNDEMMLPGALKYGGLPAFAALCAPHELYLYNHKGTGMGQWVKPAYDAARASDHLKMDAEKVEVGKVVEWLLR